MKAKSVISIDVGGNNIRSAIVSQEGELSFRLEEKTVQDRSFLGVARQIQNFTEMSVNHAASQGLAIKAMGISIPGYIHHEKKIITFAPNFKDFRNVSFENELKKHFSLPIKIENDGNCHALGEWWKGKGAGMGNVISLVLGTGVGGGVVTDGRLVRGAHGAGGELGHIVVDPQGPMCGCEARGCLEAFASATALEKKYRRSPLVLEQHAKEGDLSAIEAFEKVGYYLGIAIASLCSIFEPEMVVLAGKISKGADLFFPALLQEAHDRLKNHPSKDVRIEKAMFIDDAGLLGAAWVALHEVA